MARRARKRKRARRRCGHRGAQDTLNTCTFALDLLIFVFHHSSCGQGKKGKKEKKGKKKKDPTADRSIESLFAELVSNGILVPCPHVHVRDYLGSTSFMQATLEKAAVIPDPSMAQIRQV